MPTISPTSAFTDLLRFGSYLVVGQLTVYSGGVPTIFTVPVSTASVTVTRNSAQRRQFEITAQITPTIPPPPILPTSPSSILTPFGNEVNIQIGIAPNGNLATVHWTPLGICAMSTVTTEDTGVNLEITIQGYDRSWVIGQRKLKQPYNSPAVTGNFVAEIKHLLNMVWGSTPALQYNIVPTTATVPVASFNQGATPWTAALQMANAVGYELFFDATGVVTGYPIPTPDGQPVVWNFTDTANTIFGNGGTGGSTTLEGSPYSTPTDVKVQFTRDGVFNDVIVTGTGSYNATGSTSGSTAPVLGEASTTTPKSSTYVNGPVGDIPEFVASNLILANAQAQAAAQNYLKAALSDAWQISITVPSLPFIDIDDVVTVTRPRVGLYDVKVVVDTITHTVSYGTKTVISGRVVP